MERTVPTTHLPVSGGKCKLLSQCCWASNSETALERLQLGQVFTEYNMFLGQPLDAKMKDLITIKLFN